MLGGKGMITLAVAYAVLTHHLVWADDSPPSALTTLDMVEANTVEAHTGRQAAAIDNTTTLSQPFTEANSTALAPAFDAATSAIASAGNAVGGAMSSAYNVTGGAITSAYNVTSQYISNITSNITAFSPAPAQSAAKSAAKAPSAGYWVVGDGGGLFITSDGDWSYSDSRYAVPIAIILLLLLLAGAGLFFVVRRRRATAARNYYGLKESELGSTHRAV